MLDTKAIDAICIVIIVTILYATTEVWSKWYTCEGQIYIYYKELTKT